MDTALSPSGSRESSPMSQRSPSPAIVAAALVSSPIRKRARVDDEIEEMLGRGSGDTDFGSPAPTGLTVKNTVTLHSYDPSEIVRDDTYYMDDGSVVIQVNNTLFNVHRSILSRDSSMFSSMFALPQGEAEVDGTSDAHPLRIAQLVTVEQFRNFLWALYALPHELMVVHSPQADLKQLMDIASVSFKLQFKSLEKWALDAINDHVNRKESPIFSLPLSTTAANTSTSSRNAFSVNRDQIASLMQLADLCNHDRLLTTMVTLLRRLMGLSIQYAHLAMDLADQLNIRTLRGAAYLEVMQKAVVVVRRGKGRAPVLNEDADEEDTEYENIDADGRLVVTPEQQLRLLTGYYRLTAAWEKIRVQPIPFDHAASCGATWHQHGCTQSWLDFWKEKTKSDTVLQLGLADLLGRLRAIAKEFDRWGSATYMHHECRMAARRAINTKISQVERDLPDYFMEEDT